MLFPRTSPPQREGMSRLEVYFLNVETGENIVERLRNFIAERKLQAAFVINCVGLISYAKIRLADATPGFEPIKEINHQSQINSLVGTLSAGGHLHISITEKDSRLIGGHLFGRLIASGSVKIIVANCIDLSFVRQLDEITGYNELAIARRSDLVGLALQSAANIPTHKMADHQRPCGSSLKVYALRLKPGEEIISQLKAFVVKEKLKAAFIMTCVGSVTKAKLRLAHKTSGNEIIDLAGHYEIVSLVGTLAETAHLHISLSDKDGQVIGGHVIGDLNVFTTAEIVIGECCDYQMTRDMDETTGFPELVIKSMN